MEFIIQGRPEIEELSQKPFKEKTALISITDHGWTFAKLENKPEYLLQITFDDVDSYVFEDELGREPNAQERAKIEEKYHMFTDKHATEIANFYNQIRDEVDTIICQCEFGMSRSAAVAAAIKEYRDKRGIEIFASDDYCPNKMIFRMLLSKLKMRDSIK